MINEISLSVFLKDYPHVFIATDKDNQDILNFYQQTKLASSETDIIYLRGNNFFTFLKERSEHFIVLLLKDDQGKIQGLGVLSFRPGYINNQLTTVGYLGDLRVKMNRKLIREWRKMYAELIRQSPRIQETQNCSYYQTVLIDENTESRNNLAMNRISNLHYHRLADYKMINIWGRIRNRRLSNYSISSAQKINHDEIIKFLTQSQSELFAHDWEKEFERRLKYWSNFNYSNCILVRDNQERIVAITSVWNPKANKQVQINKIPPLLKIAHKCLSIIPFLELKPLPQINQNIDILYLNQICFAERINEHLRKKIISQIFHFVFDRPFHLLAYADYIQNQYVKNNFSLFSTSMNMAVYSVHYQDPNGEIHFPLKQSTSMVNTYFDMALV